MLRQKAVPSESDPHRLSLEAIEGQKAPQTTTNPDKSGPHYFTCRPNRSQAAPDRRWGWRYTQFGFVLYSHVMCAERITKASRSAVSAED
jgi:hypothetical protein